MTVLQNYVAGEWRKSSETQVIPVVNPANQEEIGLVPVGAATKMDIDKAVQEANAALPGWRDLSVNERIQPLFKLKALLEAHKEELAVIITQECGKTKVESLGELTRAIEK